MRVLVVEDDDRVARGLVRALRRAGHRVVRAADLAQAHAHVTEQVPDLALVDMGLPDGHGVEVVRRLREHPGTGVLVVTAQGEEADRVLGLRAGADDYVVKPFGLAELMARIDAVARRTRALRQQVEHAPTLHRCEDLVLDVDLQRLSAGDGWTADLTRTETSVLALLLDRAGQAVPRDFVLDQVWGSVLGSHSRSLDTHMATLRGKLRERVEIRTVRGVGFCLEPRRGEA